MSGVYIKGMEMPKSCWCCACHHHKVDVGYYDYDVCRASGTVFNDGYSSVTGNKVHIDPFKQRLDNCPLIPVPDHGRLIDVDALIDELPNNLGIRGLEYLNRQESAIVSWIRAAPTIIPADKEV